jgi:hypothetical protein
MKLKDQVCTLEQARSLKGLGVIQESICFWYQQVSPRNPNMHEYGIPQEQMRWHLTPLGKQSTISTQSVYAEYAAFTVAELGVMLPEFIDKAGKEFRIQQWHNVAGRSEIKQFNNEEFRIAYRKEPADCMGEIGDNFYEKTEAQVRARMLIYLLESKLTTPEEVNKRLSDENK